MVNWRIWYDDGKIYTNEDSSPESLPVDGVQIIMEYNSDGTRHILQGSDYYCWVGSWISGNQRDLDCWLRKRPSTTLTVLFGRWSAINVYKDVVEQAMRIHENH